MPARWVNLSVDGEEMEAYVASPSGDGPHPAVIVVQEIWGVNGYIQSIANRLAANGYFAIAPALFHREGSGTLGLFEETELAFERLGRLRDEQILADLRSTAAFLQAEAGVRSDRIGIVGFCVGGRVAYLAAANLEELTAAVDFYGGRCFVAMGDGLTPFDQTANIRVPLLGLFGEDDQNPNSADVEQMRQELERHGKEYEFHVYPGAGHGFNCEERPTYRREAAVHAWGRALAWFEEHLKG
jgi:carboxymethylenebutenolidase